MFVVTVIRHYSLTAVRNQNCEINQLRNLIRATVMDKLIIIYRNNIQIDKQLIGKLKRRQVDTTIFYKTE